MATLVAAALLTGCGGGGPATTDYSGAVLTDPYVVPDTALTATDGSRFSLAGDTDRRLTLVFFGYVNCPDICHTVMSNLTAGLTRLDPADRDQVDVVFVTTDPARDTRQALGDYLARYDPGFVGLTGDLATISDIGLDLGVAVEQGEKLPSGGYEVTHGTQVIGVDSDDRAPIVWTEGTSASEFADDIHLLLNGDV
ncbi:SCO family protein [Nocardioides coralli]|uniref:SCO family protein n=1 Tax=Nocardioides coralli TaxID=2872154 RepID=UPI001CA45C57|nr:SCO family protein [Nocardioides coralli]QZY27918.1 SCO family protein [Nocardioides coralli]